MRWNKPPDDAKWDLMVNGNFIPINWIPERKAQNGQRLEMKFCKISYSQNPNYLVKSLKLKYLTESL